VGCLRVGQLESLSKNLLDGVLAMGDDPVIVVDDVPPSRDEVADLEYKATT
jgi:hypothetical protein